jgi:Tat protein secretion system quality control protein TatD with DNase activity
MEIIAAVQETDINELAEQIYTNTASLFFPHL